MGVGVGSWIRVDEVSIAERRESVALEEDASGRCELLLEVDGGVRDGSDLQTLSRWWRTLLLT